MGKYLLQLIVLASCVSLSSPLQYLLRHGSQLRPHQTPAKTAQEEEEDGGGGGGGGGEEEEDGGE